MALMKFLPKELGSPQEQRISTNDNRRRKRTTYRDFRTIGEALVNPDLSNADRMEVIFDVMDGMCAYGTRRVSEAAYDSLQLVKRDLKMV